MRKLLALVAVGLSLTACEGRLPANVTRADSAGVTIVTSGPERMTDAPTWSLSAVPVEKIQVPRDTAGQPSRVGDIVPLPEGQLAVADATSAEVLVFNEGGTLAVRFSRTGGVPGEFEHISSLVRMDGDSLGVFDGARRALSVFDSKGRYARLVSLSELITAAGAASGTARLEPLSDGSLALITLPGFGDERGQGVYRPESEWLRIDADGARLASYGRVPGHEVFVTENSSGRPLFGRFTAFATSGKDLIVGTGAATEFQLRDRSGDLRRIVRWPDPGRSVTDARLDSAIDVAATSLPEAQKREFRATMKAQPHAEEVPPYESIVASRDGYVWVGGYPDETRSVVNSWPGPALHWLVFDPHGALAATVETPAGFELKAVDGTHAIGVRADPAGSESVMVYRVEGMMDKK